MKIRTAFDHFLEYKKASGLSRESLDAYFFHCLYFIRVFGGLEVDSLDQAMISAFQVALLECSLSSATKSSYIRSVRVFLRWLSTEYDVNYDYYKIKVPRMPKRQIRLYSEQDLQLIFDSIRARPSWVQLRNRALFALLVDSGIRRAEAVSLLRADVDFDNFRLLVTGKGDKQRYVHFGDLTASLMKSYLLSCPESDLVFVSVRGGRLSENAISQMFHDLQDRLPFKLSPHKLRHNFATNYCLDQYDRGQSVDPFLLQSLMGHEDLKTTQRYLHQAQDLIAVRSCPSHLDIIKDRSDNRSK